MMRYSLVLCIVFFLPALSHAHNLYEPDWHGQEGTTFADWSFSNADNPTLPELFTNPYVPPSPTATVTIVDSLAEGWLSSLPGVGTQTGLWDLGRDGTIEFDIENRPEPFPYKEIWVQVTYLLEPTLPPIVDIPGAAKFDELTVEVEHVEPGGWYLELTKWRIEPNPPNEKIILTSDTNYGAVVDQVVVHTICIPEPASLGLLALGGLAFLRKRRK